jgi:outer membrane immunogenic protein
MKRFLLATVSMVALTSAARTADMPGKAPMYAPAPVADWTGVYLGIQGGAVRRDAQAELGSFGFKLDGSKTGGTAGAVLGYNWQQGRFVYGIEGDRSWMAPEPVILATWQPFRLRLMSIGFPRFVDVRGSHSTRPCST